MSKISYRDSGVDVEAGDQLVEWLIESETSGHVKAKKAGPRADQVVSGIGGFAAVFRAQFSHLKKPCLVAATDGIGTKILLASQANRFSEVAQDLVAMCVNDLACSGAEPLFFLDYYATSKLDATAAKQFLVGVRKACAEVNCALIGGETAEMPGVYKPGDFDAAGFAVGVVDEDEMLGPSRVDLGDQLVGVSSSGFHSNGFSLLRKLFEEEVSSELATGAAKVSSSSPEHESWIDRLLVPTALYVNLILDLKRQGLIKAAAHITGGGMENVPRVLPRGSQVKLIDWAWPEAFIEVQERSHLSREEMLQTLNCGVGMVLVCSPKNVAQVEQAILSHKFRAFSLGRVELQAGVGALNEASAAEPRMVY